MSRDSHWRDVVADAAEECGAVLTPEQVEHIAGTCQSAHENYGMSFYSPPAGEHITSENERLRRELRAERDKIGCHECGGTGRLKYNSGPWAVDTQCGRCHGEGKHKP